MLIKISESVRTLYRHVTMYITSISALSSQGGFTPLMVAAQNGHSQVAELLLSKGADVNLPNKVH